MAPRDKRVRKGAATAPKAKDQNSTSPEPAVAAPTPDPEPLPGAHPEQDDAATKSSVGLRRSTRSTRASVKPIYDLIEVDTKKEKKPKKSGTHKEDAIILSDDDDNDNEEKEITIEDDEESNDGGGVQLVELDNEDDEDYKEPKPARGRGRRKSSKKAEQAIKQQRDEQGIDSDEEEEQASNKAPKKTGAAGRASSGKQAKTKAKAKSKTSPSPEPDGDVEVYYQLSEKEMAEVNSAFDLNCPTSGGDEELDSDQLKTALRSAGFEPRADEVQRLVKKFSNRRGKINRDGFHKIMSFKLGSVPGLNEKHANDEISRVFNLLDLDKTGKITMENLKSISIELNEQITDEELLEMIQEADLDGDLEINREEFFNIMKKTSLY